MTTKEELYKSSKLEVLIQVLGIGITSLLVDLLGFMYLLTAIFISGFFWLVRFYVSKHWIFNNKESGERKQ